MWHESPERWFAIVNGCTEIFGIQWHRLLILFIIFIIVLWISEHLAYERGRVEEAEKNMIFEEGEED